MSDLTVSTLAVKDVVTRNKGRILGLGEESTSKKADKADTKITRKVLKSSVERDLKTGLAQLDQLRKGDKDNAPVDMSLADFAKEKWGFAPSAEANGTPESFYEALGLRGDQSVESLITLGEINEGYTWLIPELFREAVRLGLRKAPEYKKMIRAEESVKDIKMTMPDIKMSDMQMKKIAEGETIPVGSISFGTKEVKINKIGRGFKITDEAVRYVQLNMVAIAFEDAGVLLGMAQTAMAVQTLIDGDQLDGSDSVAVIGTENANAFIYRDLLRAWIRMQRIGNTPSMMISNEGPALDILELEEFKGFAGGTRLGNLNLSTPIPQNQDYLVHGAVPNNDYLLLLNAAAAMIKLNATALRVETDRIVNRQLDEMYVTMTTGFATLKRDARLILDRSQDYAVAGFPSYMNVDPYESAKID